MSHASLGALNDELRVSGPGPVSVGLVGTFSGTVLLQVKETLDSDTNFRTQKTYTVTGADDTMNLAANETARLTMSAYTSGSVAASITPSAGTRFPLTDRVFGAANFTGITNTGDTSQVNSVTSGFNRTSVGAALTAAGTTRADALALTAQVNNLTTVAANTGVILPASATAGVGANVVISNNGANTVKVYAAGSDTIDGTAGSTGVTQVADANADYVVTAANTWVKVS